MRKWQGVTGSDTDIDGGFLALRNVSLRIQGELRRRPGLGTKYTTANRAMSMVEHPVAGAFVVVSDGSGNVVGSALTTATNTTLKTGLSSDFRGNFASNNGKLYYNDDFDSTIRIDRGDANAFTAGIAAPSVTPTASDGSAGLSTAGVHRIRYRYRDTTTGYPSNPSAEVSLTSTGTTIIVVGVTASGDAKVNNIIVEMTAAGGSVFYIVDTSNLNSTGNVSVSMTDTTLLTQLASDSYYGDFGHEPPPTISIMAEHRGRMFGWITSKRTRTGCTISNGSPTISGTLFPTNTAWNGRLVLVNAETTPYVIVSTTSTTITLSKNYGGAASGGANSIVVYATAPDMLYWSRAGYPESWKPSAWARRVLNNNDTPTALISANDILYVFGQRTVRAFVYTVDPAAAQLRTIPVASGCYNQNCVINADGRVFYYGQGGAFELQGGIPTHISLDIDFATEALIDRTQMETFHGVYDPYERVLWWFFCRTGDTVPKDYIAYDLITEQWTQGTFRQGIQCSFTIGSSQISARPYLGDANGYIWRLANGVFDGVPSSMSSGLITCNTGSTVSVLQINEALPTGSTNLNGVILFNPTTLEAIAIASNTASTITLASPLATAPSAATELYLGSIDCYGLAEWWIGPKLQFYKRPGYVTIEHLSDTGVVQLQLRFFVDYSATPNSFTLGANDTPPDGVTFANGGTIMTVDTSKQAGVLYCPFSDKWHRLARWEMTQNRPVGLLRLLDIDFLVTDKEQIDTAVHTS